AIAVEDLTRDPLTGTEDLFLRLAPARMRHIRIHIRPEAVFGSLQLFPEAHRTFGDEAYFHDRLDGLEPVFPRQMQPDRRAHRFGDRLAIGAGDHESELVHGFSDGDALDIGPGVAAEQSGPLARCDVGLVEGLEPDVFCVRIGLGDRHQILEWETGPRNDHRPRLDAAMPHDALFKRD